MPLGWSTSRKVHNKRMHALNGNTCSGSSSVSGLTSEQMSVISANRQQALARKAVLQTIAANRAAALARKEAKRQRCHAGLQPPDTWTRPGWHPPLVPATPTDFVRGHVPEVSCLTGVYQ